MLAKLALRSGMTAGNESREASGKRMRTRLVMQVS